MTWDYWDEPHQWNLAIEAWSSGELEVYSTKVVNPKEFSELKKGGLIIPLSPELLIGLFQNLAGDGK